MGIYCDDDKSINSDSSSLGVVDGAMAKAPVTTTVITGCCGFVSWL